MPRYVRQVTGYLIQQNYREGDAVRKGQLLFEIDPRTFQVAVSRPMPCAAGRKLFTTRPWPIWHASNHWRQRTRSARRIWTMPLGQEASARAALDQATAALETARLNLGFTRVTSPIDGIAGIAKAQIGDLLSPSATSELTTVSKVDPIKVYVNISEREYVRWRSVTPGTARPDAVGDDPGRRQRLSEARQVHAA